MVMVLIVFVVMMVVAAVLGQELSRSKYRLVGLVVRRLLRERNIPGSNPACDGIFSGSSQTSD